MIVIKTKGNFTKTMNFFRSLLRIDYMQILKDYGERGVNALRDATPIDTGLTANSWYYDIVETQSGLSIRWSNSNIQNGLVIAILLEYGHATKNGGYVEGRDYINPALRSEFEDMAARAWKEVLDA